MNDEVFQQLLNQFDAFAPSGLAGHVDGLIATHRDSLEIGQMVDLLYFEYLARTSGREMGVIDDLCRRHPEFEVELLRQVQVDTELSKWDETVEITPSIQAGQLKAHQSAKTIGGYTVMEKLGEGAQAEVFRVVHPMLRCELALKIGKHQTDEVNRVLDEGRLLVNVNDPGIARVIDAGICNSHPFIVSELVRGVTLKKRVDQKSLTIPELVEFVSGLSRTVAKLHSAGIVHCDIKPTNVLFDANGQSKLVDFGMAVDHSTEAWDADAVLRGERSGGTLAYMAPELISGAKVKARDSIGILAARDPTGDIFSLGGLLYFGLVGRHPYASTDPSRVVEAVANGEWGRQSLRDSAAPAALQRVCEQAMATRPEARVQTANQFADVLDGWLARSQRNTGRRGVMIAVPLIALLIMGSFTWHQRPEPSQMQQPFPTIPTTETVERFGNLDVKVWAEDRAFDLVNRVPVATGERVQINAPLRAKHHGQLWLLDSDGKSTRLGEFEPKNEARWVHYPRRLDEAVPLVGPAGTEAIVWLESLEPLLQQEIAAAFGEPDHWPKIGQASVFRLVDGKLLVEQDDRSFGEPISLESSDAVVQKHLRIATTKLQNQGNYVEILAFSHID